jgi:hypothetical protein
VFKADISATVTQLAIEGFFGKAKEYTYTLLELAVKSFTIDIAVWIMAYVPSFKLPSRPALATKKGIEARS